MTSSIHKITCPSIKKIDLDSHDPPDRKKQVHLRDEHYNLIPNHVISSCLCSFFRAILVIK